MKIEYVAKIKNTNNDIKEETFFDSFKAREWAIKNQTIDTKVVEIEERKRNEYGLPIETTIKYYYY